MKRSDFIKYTVATLSLVTTALFCFAVVADGALAVDFYNFGCLAAIGAGTGLVLMTLEGTVDRTMRREIDKSRAILARSIAVALADEIECRVPDDASALSDEYLA